MKYEKLNAWDLAALAQALRIVMTEHPGKIEEKSASALLVKIDLAKNGTLKY